MNLFSERLKFLRNRKRLTQQELSDALGISRTAIAGYERLGKEPHFDNLIRIANYFNVTTDYLLGISDKEFEHDSRASFYEKIDNLFTSSRYFANELYGANKYLGFSSTLYDIVVKAYEKELQYHVEESIFDLFCVVLDLFKLIDRTDEYVAKIDVKTSGLNKKDIAKDYLMANAAKLPKMASNIIEDLIDGCYTRLWADDYPSWLGDRP